MGWRVYAAYVYFHIFLVCSKWEFFFLLQIHKLFCFTFMLESEGQKTNYIVTWSSDQEQLGVREELKAKFQIIIDGLYHFGWSNHNISPSAFFPCTSQAYSLASAESREPGSNALNCTLVLIFDWNHYTLIHQLQLLKSRYPKLCPTSHRKIMMLQIIYSGSIGCVLQQYKSIVIPTLTHCSCALSKRYHKCLASNTSEIHHITKKIVLCSNPM